MGYFVERWNYDLWANSVWLDFLEGREFPDPEMPVFSHILAAQEIWFQRVQGVSPTSLEPMEPTRAVAESLRAKWVDLVQTRDRRDVISYRRITGEEFELTFEAIVRHVLNHGTYHRGELRGIQRMKGIDDFPDTDMSRWYFLE